MTLKVNFILRQEISKPLEKGKEYLFTKQGKYLMVDEIPIWLCQKDWTPLAEIQVVAQTRENDVTSGKYKVLHVYSGKVQQTLKQIFIRMYGWE